MLSIWSKLILVPLNIVIMPLITLNMSSMFFMWLIIELNTFIFIFFIIFNDDKTKNLMNYFIIQAFTSLILIFIITISKNELNYLINLMMLIMNLIMWVKMGLFPFHNWFINMMKYSSWLSCFILSTSQKFPIFIMWSQFINLKVVYLIIILSAPAALMNMFFLNELKLILGFSSIIHSCWMLLNLTFNENLMLFYYLIYFLINSSIMNWLHKWNVYNFLDLYILNKHNLKMFILLSLSLSGLPPFSGFLMKWISINYLSMMSFIILMILIITSILSIYFYINISLPGFSYFFLSKNLLMLIPKPMSYIMLSFCASMVIYSFSLMFFNVWILE